MLELQPAAADELFRLGERKIVIGFHRLTAFCGDAPVDPDLARHDGALRLFTTLAQPALDQRLIQSLHQRKYEGVG